MPHQMGLPAPTRTSESTSDVEEALKWGPLPLLCLTCPTAETERPGRQRSPRAGARDRGADRQHPSRSFGALADGAAREPAHDRDLIERHVDRIVVKTDAITLHLRDAVDGMDPVRSVGDPQDAGAQKPPPAPLSLPWVSGGFAAVKGVVYSPAPSATMAAETGGALLAAIAKARGWIADLLAGRAAGFAHIARCEGKVERHVRFLAPLAFVSPQIVASIIDRSAPADLTVTALAKALPSPGPTRSGASPARTPAGLIDGRTGHRPIGARFPLQSTRRTGLIRRRTASLAFSTRRLEFRRQRQPGKCPDRRQLLPNSTGRERRATVNIQK